jgi:hypothetical protein
VSCPGCLQENARSDSQSRSGGRNRRESNKENSKSHGRSLPLASNDGLDGAVICLPRAGTADEGFLMDMMNGGCFFTWRCGNATEDWTSG